MIKKADEEQISEIIEDEDSSPDLGDPLEAKYVKQMRQIHPQKIELPISALRQMVDEQIQLDPTFQRRDRWDNKKRSRLMESIIMNVPIPPVFLGEDKYGQYVVLDGRQRLTAVYEFLRNTYALEKLEIWGELNGLRYSDLENRSLAPILRRRFIPAILLLKESSPEVKYDVFDRLNTGGVTANQMEIRNAVFQGKFNRLLHKLSADPQFLAQWGIPLDEQQKKENALFSTMADVQLVLRFFALRNPSEMKKSFKWFLGNYMDTRNQLADDDPAILIEDEKAFLRGITLACKVFGATGAFKKPGSEAKSAPLWDATMVAFSRVDDAKLVEGDLKKLGNAISELCTANDEFKNSISQGTNGKGAIVSRVGLATKAVAGACQKFCV